MSNTQQVGKDSAVIYCRVSTIEQVDNNSLPNQKKACIQYCERQGIDVAKVFVDEGESAKTKDRPALLSLIEYCRKNKDKIQAVVVWKIDRLSRNQHDFHVLRAMFSSYGVRLRSVTEVIEDDPAGKLMEGILAAFAQFDNDVRAERTIVGMRASLQAGKWTWGAPLGYLNCRDANGDASLKICPKTGPLVKKIFEMYGTGRFSQEQMLKHARRLGLKGKNGFELRGQTLNKILRNSLYAGVIDCGLLKGEKVRGNFEPLISEELFETVQAIRSGKLLTITPHLRNNPDFPLRMFTRCGVCGKPLTASWSRGNGGKYGYYRCRTKGCFGVNIRKELLERLFCEFLQSLRPKPAYVRFIRKVIDDNWNAKQANSIAERRALEQQIGKLQDRKQRLVELLVKGTLDEDTYKEQAAKIDSELVVKRMELNEAEMEGLDIEALLNFAEHLILNAERLWREANLDHKQRLQRAFFPEGVTFSNGEFGTTATCLLFNNLQTEMFQKTTWASPRGVEPLLPA